MHRDHVGGADEQVFDRGGGEREPDGREDQVGACVWGAPEDCGGGFAGEEEGVGGAGEEAGWGGEGVAYDPATVAGALAQCWLRGPGEEGGSGVARRAVEWVRVRRRERLRSRMVRRGVCAMVD